MYVLSHSPFFVTPMDRLLCPWDFSDKNTGVGCHFPPPRGLPDPGSNLCLLCLLLWDGYFTWWAIGETQEYWSRLPFPIPGDIFPTQAMHLCLLHLLHWQEDSLPLEPPGKPWFFLKKKKKNLCVCVRVHVTRLHANETKIQTVWKSTQWKICSIFTFCPLSPKFFLSD